MRILCLWVDKYFSGSTSERFLKPLKALGHQCTVMPLEDGNVEKRLFEATNVDNYDMLLHLPYPNTMRLEIIQHLPIRTVAWNGDDEHYWQIHPEFAKKIEETHDYCITTYKPALERYRNGILGSWGYSDDWAPKKTEKDIDIYFCGSKTPIRDMYIEALIDAGFKIVLDGSGYSGKVPFKTMIDRYRRAKIGLNFVTENKDKFIYQQVKARTFEIPAVGTFMLSENCREIHDYFRQQIDFDTFIDTKSLVRLCKYYLKENIKRELIAKSGHKRNKKYSYELMFDRVFKEIKDRETLRPDQIDKMNPHQKEVYEKA